MSSHPKNYVINIYVYEHGLNFIFSLFFVVVFGLSFLKNKHRMLQVYRKIHRFCDVIYYFTNGQWYFTNQNVQQLWNKLTPQDQQLFAFNMADLNWSEAINMSMYGIRTYLMKEDPNNIPEALKRTQRYIHIHKNLHIHHIQFINQKISTNKIPWKKNHRSKIEIIFFFFKSKSQLTSIFSYSPVFCRLKILHFATIYSIYTALLYFVYMLLSKFFLPVLSANNQI